MPKPKIIGNPSLPETLKPSRHSTPDSVQESPTSLTNLIRDLTTRIRELITYEGACHIVPQSQWADFLPGINLETRAVLDQHPQQEGCGEIITLQNVFRINFYGEEYVFFLFEEGFIYPCNDKTLGLIQAL